MKKITQMLLLMGVVLLAVTTSTHAASHWETDFEHAQKLASESGKYMLLDFTGSDWCGWCIRLKDEVFSKKSFLAYAKEKLVLVQVDFPRKKAQSKELKEQNQALASKYGIRGYPTIIILSPKGDFVQQTGYQAGGAEAYVEHLEELIAQSK
jgi:protein disulfide-isomerase